MHTRVYPILFILSLLAACEFDGDLRNQVRTQRGIFWSQADDGSRRLWSLQDGDFRAEPEIAWGISSADVLRLTEAEGLLWIALQNPNAIWSIDPVTDEIQQRIPLGSVRPDFLSIGENSILTGDSSSRQLAFFDRNAEELIVDTLSGQPGHMVYRSQKYYVQTDTQEVSIYIEPAFAPISVVRLSHPIVEMGLDNGVQTIVVTQAPNEFVQANINYNTNRLQTEFSVRYRKFRPTPFDHQIYGREYLENARLNDLRFFPGDLQPTTDYELDFFESQLYLIRRDSLIQRSLISNEERYIRNFSDSLLKACFFVGELGN